MLRCQSRQLYTIVFCEPTQIYKVIKAIIQPTMQVRQLCLCAAPSHHTGYLVQLPSQIIDLLERSIPLLQDPLQLLERLLALQLPYPPFQRLDRISRPFANSALSFAIIRSLLRELLRRQVRNAPTSSCTARFSLPAIRCIRDDVIGCGCVLLGKGSCSGRLVVILAGVGGIGGSWVGVRRERTVHGWDVEWEDERGNRLCQ